MFYLDDTLSAADLGDMPNAVDKNVAMWLNKDFTFKWRGAEPNYVIRDDRGFEKAMWLAGNYMSPVFDTASDPEQYNLRVTNMANGKAFRAWAKGSPAHEPYAFVLRPQSKPSIVTDDNERAYADLHGSIIGFLNPVESFHFSDCTKHAVLQTTSTCATNTIVNIFLNTRCIRNYITRVFNGLYPLLSKLESQEFLLEASFQERLLHLLYRRLCGFESCMGTQEKCEHSAIDCVSMSAYTSSAYRKVFEAYTAQTSKDTTVYFMHALNSIGLNDGVYIPFAHQKNLKLALNEKPLYLLLETEEAFPIEHYGLKAAIIRIGFMFPYSSQYSPHLISGLYCDETDTFILFDSQIYGEIHIDWRMNNIDLRVALLSFYSSVSTLITDIAFVQKDCLYLRSDFVSEQNRPTVCRNEIDAVPLVQFLDQSVEDIGELRRQMDLGLIRIH